ncbi:MAG: tRNA (adenosine(37)-N6)-threonylcarbamoyltransferase complex dimerization subunit type 1 TsaB, partial [Chloroflexota bacterium]
ADLGWRRLKRGERDDPATLAPIYLSQPEGSAP